MPTTFSTNARMAKPAVADRNWDVPINANVDFLDGLSAIGQLLVTAAEQPSASLQIRVTAGSFRRSDGTAVSFPGIQSVAVAASATSVVWLDEAGQIATGTAFPIASHVRLARVTTNATVVTSVVDERVSFQAVVTSAAEPGAAGGSGGEPALFSESGAAPMSTPGITEEGERWVNATPEPGPPLPFLQDATAGFPGSTVEPVGDESTANNFATLTATVNALIAVLRKNGLLGR